MLHFLFQLCLCTNEFLRQDILDELENIAEALRSFGIEDEKDASRDQQNKNNTFVYMYFSLIASLIFETQIFYEMALPKRKTVISNTRPALISKTD